MSHNQDRERANLGEQTDMSERDVERQDRSMSAGERLDRTAGAEGIEDPAMERSSRERMSTSSSDRSGRASSHDMARASRRSWNQDRRINGDSASFRGQGRQKEGSSSSEGTGYTSRSKTDESDSET